MRLLLTLNHKLRAVLWQTGILLALGALLTVGASDPKWSFGHRPILIQDAVAGESLFRAQLLRPPVCELSHDRFGRVAIASEADDKPTFPTSGVVVVAPAQAVGLVGRCTGDE